VAEGTSKDCQQSTATPDETNERTSHYHCNSRSFQISSTQFDPEIIVLRDIIKEEEEEERKKLRMVKYIARSAT